MSVNLPSGVEARTTPQPPSPHDDGDMTEMLNELRVLLPGSQLLTAFLITLPFNSGFRQIVAAEKWVFIATFICSLSSLILFTAPAVQHRMLRPLLDRAQFKNLATNQMLVGAVALSLALILSANLVISEVFGYLLGGAVTAAFTLLILTLWWLYPWWLRQHLSQQPQRFPDDFNNLPKN